MTNKLFYVFCRDQRKIETDPQKQQVLKDVYGYVRECGVTKAGVAQYVERRVYQLHGDTAAIAAYQWLSDVFAGTVAIALPVVDCQAEQLW